MKLEIGTTFRTARTFSKEDVARFCEVADDFGRHHVEPDDRGRVVVHGLHTASIATRIGGEIDFLARTMDFEFLAPVYSGDTVTCVATVDEAEHGRGRSRYAISFVFRNQDGDTVARGASRGVVLHRGEAADPP